MSPRRTLHVSGSRAVLEAQSAHGLLTSDDVPVSVGIIAFSDVALRVLVGERCQGLGLVDVL